MNELSFVPCFTWWCSRQTKKAIHFYKRTYFSSLSLSPTKRNLDYEQLFHYFIPLNATNLLYKRHSQW